MHQIVAAADQEVGGLAVILPPLYEIFWSALVLLIVLLLVGGASFVWALRSRR